LKEKVVYIEVQVVRAVGMTVIYNGEERQAERFANRAGQIPYSSRKVGEDVW